MYIITSSFRMGGQFPEDFGDTTYPSDGHIVIEELSFLAVPSDSTPNTGEALSVDINFDTLGMSVPTEMLGSFTGSISWDSNVLDYMSHSDFQSGFTGTVDDSGARC